MTDQATREAAADLIDAARGIMQERGCFDPHATAPVRPGVGSNGSVCVLRALAMADARGVDVRVVATNAVRLAAGVAGSVADTGLAAWSDSTPYEDVVLTMKRAAHSLRDGAL